MREYALIFLVAAATTYLLSVVARELAMRFGAVARIRDRDIHEIPIPYFGGVAIMAGLVTALLVARHLPFLGSSPGRDQIFHDAFAVLIGGALICAVGVVDDIFELDWVTKLAGEVVAAGVVAVQGVQVYWLPIPAEGSSSTVFPLASSQAALITVLLIVVTANAVNFVDGLDGLAAGVVAIGAIAFAAYSLVLVEQNSQERATTSAILTAALAGACIGFLPHNFFPARIFMGDSGALLIGLMLACSAISLTGQFAPTSLNQGLGGSNASVLPTLLPLILPFAVLMIPLVDFTLAVVRRTLAGRSPYAPDRKHLHHRLLDMGHSHRRAVLVLYLWAALVAFGLVAVSLLGGWMSVAAVLAMAALAVLLTFGLPGHRGLIGKQT
jgi:UDP-GlcNAc:undecaprenyl-phosphate GlcNAc-1-phosphate transferase